MTDDKYTYATEFSDASASLDKMRDSLRDVSSSTSDWVKNFSTLQDSLNDMTSAMSNLTEKPLVSKEDVANADKLLSAMTRIKKMKEDGKRADEKQVGLFKAMDVLSKSISRNFKITETDLKNIAKQWTNIRGTTAQVARSHIGIDLSLTGIVMALVDTYNLMRRIHGESMMIAGKMGGTTKAIGASKAAIGDLHKNFAMSYDDAAKIVHVLGKVGISADRLASGAKRQSASYQTSKDLLEEQTTILKNMSTTEKFMEISRKNENMSEKQRMEALRTYHGWEFAEKQKLHEVEKKISAEREKHLRIQEQIAKTDARRAAIASEVYAIQVKYGIGVEQSANQLKNLMANYGKTDEQARALYGTVLGTFDALAASGELPFDISAEELVGDWGKLIEYARVYKIDMLGILSVYQSMLRDSKLIGLEGVSTQVKKEITKTLVSAPLEMSYGWKARLAEGGGTPAQRAIEFEKRASDKEKGPLYVLKRTVDVMDEMLGTVTEGNKADQEIRGRMLLEKMGYGKESAVELTRAWLSKGLTGKNVDKLLKSQADDLKSMKKSEEQWTKHRGDLIDYGRQAAVAVTSTQDLVKRYVIDILIPAVIAIRDGIRVIMDSEWLGGTGKAGAERRAKEDMDLVMQQMGIGGKLTTEKIMTSRVLTNEIFKSGAYKDLSERSMTAALKKGGAKSLGMFLGGELSVGDIISGKGGESPEVRAAISKEYRERMSGGLAGLKSQAVAGGFEALSPTNKKLFVSLMAQENEQATQRAISILEKSMEEFLRVERTKPATDHVGSTPAVGPRKKTK